MSRKIYEAYKIKQSRLEDFLKYVHDPTLDKAFEQVKFLLAHLKPEAIEKQTKLFYKVESLSELEGKQFLIAKWETLLELLKKNHDEIERRNPFNLQSGWNVYPHGRFFYGWPWGKFQMEQDYILAFDGVEDFSYWDNTDRDENVTARKWSARGTIWEEILENPQMARLVFKIIDFSPMAFDAQSYFEAKLFP